MTHVAFLTGNVFTGNTLRQTLTLTFDPLTLNVCSVSAVTCQTLCQIEQYRTMRFKDWKLGAVRFDRKWIFTTPRLPQTRNAPFRHNRAMHSSVFDDRTYFTGQISLGML